ncbi:hypothetical protein RHSIM_Rhsim11G0151100 [Rhododendron simsii]|uniref:Uncharacterized protein n=1 Tax=Rhododendron simsii TaxID=118357 RepID=A0A834G5W9_RHOSS|nr:hypothetical protein RHSIM_Rhsim11G0151100 [Rhododendron simsii]
MMLTLNAFAKDVIIEWFLGKFAAANAIIEALCSHLVLVEGGSSECKTSYFPIDVVALELRLVAEKKSEISVCEKNGMAFSVLDAMTTNKTLVSDADGNYKGPLMLSQRKGMYLKNLSHCTCFSQSHETALGYSKLVNQNLDVDAAFTIRHNPGRMELSLLVMGGNNSNMVAENVPISKQTRQPGIPNSYAIPNGAMSGYKATMGKIPKRAVVKLAAPMHPWVLIPRRSPNGKGTGDFSCSISCDFAYVSFLVTIRLLIPFHFSS